MKFYKQTKAYFYTAVIISALLMGGLILSPAGIFSNAASAQSAEKRSDTAAENFNAPVYFEENRGQFDQRVKYMARGINGYSLFLTATEAVYVLSDARRKVGRPDVGDLYNPKSKIQSPTSAAAVFMKLAGANENSESIGLDQLSHKTNYFKGAESAWRTGIPNYEQVRMENVYEGIDTVWKGIENGGVRYDFVIAPNADATRIEWEIEGADSVEIDHNGDLLIKTEFGEIKQQKPFTYQETNGIKQEIQSRFILKEQSETQNPKPKIQFSVGNYDRSKTLIIDPSVNLSNLAYSNFLGGGGDDEGRAIAVDRMGNVYVTGETSSSTFPTKAGTIDTTYNNNGDVFVTKLNAAGTDLVYSTFLGGSANDSGEGIAVDPAGNVFITGYTSDGAVDYPTTVGSYNPLHNGVTDVFVTKINAAGSALVYSTFIGGNSSEGAYGIAIDTSGNAFITGTTDVGYPTTVGAFDMTHNGLVDVFVTKVDAAGSALIYSTFLGGSDNDIGYDIAVNAAGSAFITGFTIDGVTDYPATFGAFDNTHNGGADAFITKLNTAGSALSYSTFLGGDNADAGYGIAVDVSGNAFITGSTADGTTDYPTTVGAFDQSHNGDTDVFVTKLSLNGSVLLYSTFLGAAAADEAADIAINTTGNAFITGTTVDFFTDYPTTAGAFDTTHNGGVDAMVTKLNAAGSALDYSTFLGGNSVEAGNGIAIDEAGNIFVTGEISVGTNNYPTTADAFDNTHNGGSDGFVTKLGDYSISGRTVDTSGLALPNTAVAMSGDNTGFVFSDAEGYFYFGDTVSFGSNLISATQILYNFNPSNYQISVNRNKQITFVGRPISSGPTAAVAAIAGNVESTAGNIGLPNTRLTLIDTYGNVTFVVTDSNGDYEFNSVLTGEFYFVVPEREGYSFSPEIQSINHLDANPHIDFSASPTSPRPVQDFDGDGKTDLAVFRPGEGNWYILQSQNNLMKVVNFGLNGDLPVAEDYDGDKRSDIAVYRPSEGNWYRINSSDGLFSVANFGLSEDKPVPADFDGDGKTDIAVYRPASGVWHRLNSIDGSYHAVHFGTSEDKPVPADFDSDGKADLVVYRPSNGVWYHLNSSDGNYNSYQFGLPEDKPMAVDFDGDGKPDTAVYRPSNGVWYSLDSADGEFNAVQFGVSTDRPVPADYNGDGRIDHAVYRDGTWYQLFSDGNSKANQFGLQTDIPVAGIR
jgi:hypothetical protein